MESNILEKRIKAFLAVRDIPYSIPLSLKEISYNCVGKGILLKNALESLGDVVRWKEGEFRWEDMGLPAAILEIPHDEHPTHVWLEVLIDGQWISVDPTWDKDLRAIFPVNDWDGKSAQQIAFPIIRTIPDEQVVITAEPLPEWEEDIKRNKEFFAAINKWLGEQRR